MVCDALAYYYLRNPLPFDMPTPKPLIPPPWKVEIIASDINYSALLTAQQGIYTESQMDTVDYTCRLRYFEKVGDKYSVKPALKSLVQFDFHNLKDRIPAAAQRRHFLPQRHDLFRRSRTKAPDRKVSPLPESGGLSLRGSRREPVRPDHEISHDSSEQRDRVPDESRRRSDIVCPTIAPPSFATSSSRAPAEILQGMNEAGLMLEDAPDDKESLRRVRRAVHTLKGDSAACGYRAAQRTGPRIRRRSTPELVRKENSGLDRRSRSHCRRHFSRNARRLSQQSAAPAGGALREHIQRLLRKPGHRTPGSSVASKPHLPGPNTNG